MEGFFKKIFNKESSVTKAAAVAAGLTLAGGAGHAQVSQEAPANIVLANEKSHLETLIKRIDALEARFKSYADTELQSNGNGYVITSEGRLAGLIESNSGIMSDSYIANEVQTDALEEHLGVQFFSRSPAVERGYEGEEHLKEEDLLTDTKMHGYVRPDKYVVIERTFDNESLVFTARIIDLASKQSETVSVTQKLSDAVMGEEIQEHMIVDLESKLWKKIQIAH